MYSSLFDLHSSSTRRHGLTVYEHQLTVPLHYDFSSPQSPSPQPLNSHNPSEDNSAKNTHHRPPSATSPTITISATELIPDGGEQRPILLYLQGGPGFPAPRPYTPTGEFGGWIGEALKHYRVILLDQRGTGLSTPVDSAYPELLGTTATDRAQYISALRANSIVKDCEALRAALIHSGHIPNQPWSLLGQSFGGFCITSYLSHAPEGVREAYITGGLPGFVPIEEIYTATYSAIATRNQRFYQQYPEAEKHIRTIAAHLRDHEEYLAPGHRLSPTLFRMIGMNLGRTGGFQTLHHLLRSAFISTPTGHRLSTSFLAELRNQLSFVQAPLYAIAHESIYGGATANITGATRWAAHRLRDSIPGFNTSNDPLDYSTPYYLTGEHIDPSFFAEDPALIPWADTADILASKDTWLDEQGPLYKPEVLSSLDIPVAATIYVDDVFVPYELSQSTASLIPSIRPYITNLWEHNGLGVQGASILRTLHQLLHDH